MGIFTWRFADDRRKKLHYGGKGCIALPDGTFIKESCYDGYGHFGEYDAYDVVADLNRPYLREIWERIEQTDSDSWVTRAFGASLKKVALIYSEGTQEELDAAIAETAKKHGQFLLRDWKRNIGIVISCKASHNEILPYPLKITSTDHPLKPYADLPISISAQ